MRVLVDTCIWSQSLRRASGRNTDTVKELRRLILEHRVEIIGPIRQELLSGIREEAHFEKLKKHLEAFPDIHLETADFTTAAGFFNTCRREGIQGSNTDFLICSVAVRRNMAVYTDDGDFRLYAGHIPLVLHEPRQA
ncbi:MAG TPA: PIN domain-containing protein [Candidatus Sabulitectum sp.]|nr:PIN domain-containing protein [Candidatus Sabulitectum sp.]HPJ27810.1 PIN domain-containing protein [Candidatus Sabulitectum sp.]HPR23483.1 PIN domain-containing protein [Candidatus Sabulitectum sp.]HRW78507.1 PIN domain-containing protein [Candidatus Sabulitectum sp.]